MDMPEIDVSFEIRQKMNRDKEAEKKRKVELERYLRGKEGMQEAKKEKEEEFAAYQRQRQAEIDAQISDDEEAIKMDDVETPRDRATHRLLLRLQHRHAVPDLPALLYRAHLDLL